MRGESLEPALAVTRRTRVRRFILVGLALVHVLSLASFGAQIDGLVGTDGILPAEHFVAELHRVLGSSVFVDAPTITLVTGASNAALHAHVVVGLLLAGVLALDVAPFFATLGLYAITLSIQIVGQDFLAFQWDLLLVETTFLALFLSPIGRISPRDPVEPPRTAIFLLRLLFARFLFSSGVVKLTSGDPTWRSLEALSYHYETTCLPSFLGYLAHGLPMGVHRLSAFAMFVIELGAPFLVFGGATSRRIAFGASVALQLMIAATGNYGFFNVLTIVLSFAVLDDADLEALRRTVRVRGRASRPRSHAVRSSGTTPGAAPVPTRRGHRAANAFATTVAVIYVALALAPLAWSFHVSMPLEGPYGRLVVAASRFRVANGYGLFATMTTRRDEIVIEGSRDGRSWQAYEFRYKPGRLDRAPPFAGFHMPRLDWQMWFAALGSAYDVPFFARFVKKLLEGSRDVRALLAREPFGDVPPRYVRARIARYRFTSLAELRATGDYWEREAFREYLPAVELANGELEFATPEAH